MSKRAVVARALRRVAAWCAVVVVLAAVAGFCYESVARQGDPSVPGRLVEVGGHRLHLHCTGSGAPTVVLEAGLAESSASWDVIQRGLPGRVCAYDRAGYAWSEDGPAPRTADRAAAELRALLAAAGEAGRYVLVGHSYGGTIVRLFAHHWPELTAGLVLIDVTDENATEALQVSRPLLAAQFTVNQVLARVGVLRLFGDALVPADATAAARASAPVVYGPGSMAAARAEAWAAADSAAQVRATVRPGAWRDLPVVVVIPAGQPATAVDQAGRLAALSSRGRVVVAGTADHYVQHAQPDLVMEAIRSVR
ncbi:alpha/beta fold hydrolase [Nonomuraea jabiensis]|uniref:Pimeloyl-ACP methyl ester carboxylesterase n=1 Tax=Nonomuraea jabiensis TaxID=882448 RepID=A0A7W9GIU9_9ACTN|nr:alpha/beta hydrolase [Nonomuraea jabiensis]MBB5784486.1 pimeloyl-ACP methyl ester carboxylesterase [Nonomuraea jabiensis]